MTDFQEWINQLLNPKVQEFIRQNSTSKNEDLAFKKNPFPKLLYADLLNQIDNRSRAFKKLPTWFNTQNIIYPATISLQQTSSELTAQYKAELVIGENGADLTGGFGVDSFCFSRQFKTFIYIEKDGKLAAITQHNFKCLNIDNVYFKCIDSNEWLNTNQTSFDWLYVDPARRDNQQKKVFRFEDCEPQILENLELYFIQTKKILIKTSPLLDISLAIEQLKYVKAIHVVAIQNELKELLFILDKSEKSPIQIHLLDLAENLQTQFLYSRDNTWSFGYSMPLNYLYLPHATFMKIGQFDQLQANDQLYKLHPHSHLFTSQHLEKMFYGKVFEIKKVIPYQKNELKLHLFNKKLNISCRNFPLKPEQLRDKWRIKDGGEDYVFFTTNHKNEKIVLFCTKL